MKTKLLIIIGILSVGGFIVAVPTVHAQCTLNDDWPDRPCLDGSTKGSYSQIQVDKWRQYYDYKGSDIMESKKLEMNNAIQQNYLKEWIGGSDENYNVWTYYYFSGEAPDISSELSLGFELINRDEKPLQNILSHHHPFWHLPETFTGLLFIGLYVLGMVIVAKIFQKRNASKMKMAVVVLAGVGLFVSLGTAQNLINSYF